MKKILYGLYNRLFLIKFNLIKTILINFLYLPLRQAVHFPILVFGPCRIMPILSGKIVLNESIHRGMLIIGESDPVRSCFNKSFINIAGTLVVGDKVTLRRGINLSILRGACLNMGSAAYIGDNNTIICADSITISPYTRCGNNTQWMDTDFHYIINTQSRVIKKNAKPIIIGENNWIGAWCVIKKGTQTPKGTILAGPYSMIGKDYCKLIEPYTLIAGAPAKELVKNIRRVQNLNSEAELSKYFEKGETQFILPNDIDIDLFCVGK